jgi:protein TonB
MFEDSLVEQRIKTHRGATTVVSFLLQLALVAIIVLIPLIFTQTMPLNVHTVTELVSPPPPPPQPPPAAKFPQTAEAQPKTASVVTQQLTEPLRIPQKIAMVHESGAPEIAAALPPVIGGVPGGIPGGQIGGVIGGVLSGVGTAIPKIAIPKRIRVTQGVSEGLLVYKVAPTYPPVAKTARVQGAVVLKAEIGRNGKVQDLQVIKGKPLLTAAALDAVKQWRYRPYYVNGQPVDVDTLITINFQLG